MYMYCSYILYEQKSLATFGPACVLVKQLSEAPAYALLFLGGRRLVADYLRGTASVDGWIGFSVPGKIISLIQALRRSLDALLAEKIVSPHIDLSASAVLSATIALLSSDGLDT